MHEGFRPDGVRSSDCSRGDGNPDFYMNSTDFIMIPIFFFMARICEFPVEQLGTMAFLLDKALVGFPFWYGLYSSLLLELSSIVIK